MEHVEHHKGNRDEEDIKHMALDITKLATLIFKPKINSVRTVEKTAKHLYDELKNCVR